MKDKIVSLARSVAAPFRKVLLGHEPAIAAWLVSAGLTLGAHFQFHPSAQATALFAVVVNALTNYTVRALVTPTAKTDLTA